MFWLLSRFLVNGLFTVHGPFTNTPANCTDFIHMFIIVTTSLICSNENFKVQNSQNITGKSSNVTQDNNALHDD